MCVFAILFRIDFFLFRLRMISLSIHQLFESKMHLSSQGGRSSYFYVDLVYGYRGRVLIANLEGLLLSMRRLLGLLRQVLLVGGRVQIVCSEGAVQEFARKALLMRASLVGVSSNLQVASVWEYLSVLLDRPNLSGNGVFRVARGSMVVVPLNKNSIRSNLDYIVMDFSGDTSAKYWTIVLICGLIKSLGATSKVF